MVTKNKLYILKVALYGRRGTWRRIAIKVRCFFTCLISVMSGGTK